MGKLELRSGAGAWSGTLDLGRLGVEAARWVYVLRQRRRWAARGKLPDDMIRDVRASLESVGIGAAQFAQIGKGDLVEVSIPFTREDEGYQLRLMPWEFLLTEAMRDVHQIEPTVVRHLSGLDDFVSPKSLERWTLVESSPGAIEDFYAFDFERRLISASLGGDPSSADNWVYDRPLADVERRLRDEQPSIVHVTGVDSREAVELLERAGDTEAANRLLPGRIDPLSPPADGMLFADPQAGYKHESYAAVGRAFGASCPRLVAYNFYRSGLRTAALTVAHGARAAVGFVESFDDALAEIFFASLYSTYRTTGHIHRSFRAAWRSIADRPQRSVLKGTGIVLWSAVSAFDAISRPASVRPEVTTAPPAEIAQAAASLANGLLAEIKPVAAINYALLHNQRSVFERFRLSLPVGTQALRGTLIEVELHVGSEHIRYRRHVELSSRPADLAADVHLPLTALFARVSDERVLASLLVTVSHPTSGVWSDSFRVAILPLDEWRDDDRDRQWLPSFVVPRDPAIARLVGQATRYLRAMSADGRAAFDGYQRQDHAGVDQQVAALWSTIVHDVGVDYTNPPPTYTAYSQRLRWPSDVCGQRLATCIDLALLLAAAIEFINVHPVVFLMRGHAFVGYWRDEVSHADFFRRAQFPDTVDASRVLVGDDRAAPWVCGRGAYLEIREAIRDATLVPVEATFLATQRSFVDAVQAGEENIEAQREFDAMIDISRARVAQVTPLPHRRRERHESD